MELHMETIGSGPPVLLVHGSVTGGRVWAEQRPLATRWTLNIVDRPGFGKSPEVDRVDFDVDAALIADLLGEPPGYHLVGHSYGGLISLLAAGARPASIRSLTVVEPPAFSIAAGDAEADAYIETFASYIANGPRDPAAFLSGFFELTGVPEAPVGPLPDHMLRGVNQLMRGERLPAEAVIPIQALAEAKFPKLIVSGGEHPIFEKVCDLVATSIGGERAVIRGKGHRVVQLGEPFNSRLEATLTGAERQLTELHQGESPVPGTTVEMTAAAYGSRVQEKLHG